MLHTTVIDLTAHATATSTPPFVLRITKALGMGLSDFAMARLNTNICSWNQNRYVKPIAYFQRRLISGNTFLNGHPHPTNKSSRKAMRQKRHGPKEKNTTTLPPLKHCAHRTCMLESNAKEKSPKFCSKFRPELQSCAYMKDRTEAIHQ